MSGGSNICVCYDADGSVYRKRMVNGCWTQDESDIAWAQQERDRIYRERMGIEDPEKRREREEKWRKMRVETQREREQIPTLVVEELKRTVPYPPTMEDLKRAFVTLHPEFTFEVRYDNIDFPRLDYPVLLDAPVYPCISSLIGSKIPPCSGSHTKRTCGCRIWDSYLRSQLCSLVREAGLTGTDIMRMIHVATEKEPHVANSPARVCFLKNAFLNIVNNRKIDVGIPLLSVFYKYLLLQPALTRSAYEQRQKERKRETHSETVKLRSVIQKIADRCKFTQKETEAVLGHINPKAGYTRDTMVALQTLNRYAKDQGIRVEDAITVIKEWTT